MGRAAAARLVPPFVVGAGVLAVVVPVVGTGPWAGPGARGVVTAFVAAALAAVGTTAVLPLLDRWARRLDPRRAATPYSALARATAGIRSGSLPAALPGLAGAVAEGTGAERAVVWLTVEDRLVAAAVHPPGGADGAGSGEDGTGEVSVPGLAVLLARPGTDHVVPVLDGGQLRAALAIGKAGAPVTADDRRLLRDLANGAGALLREVQHGVELEARVRRADELADELQRSRERLGRARDVERRRLVGELSHATAGRFVALRDGLKGARGELAAGAPPDDVRAGLARTREGLEELLERFRAIARGVYPSVLRDQGPAAALEELAADLPRVVRVGPAPDRRLDWEIESGIYYLAAAAMQHLAARPDPELSVEFDRAGGRLTVRVDDPGTGGTAGLGEALAIDAERLDALGGTVDVTGAGTGAVVVRAWLPERLEPLVEPARGVFP
ncbi:putative two-component system sensor kinase [Pseudonocardia sp. Ae168_Ps1]|uniref:HAMP domain-containing histidine kinase n=1 Tax=unclassified Pseudonocardia TaxID=2619320 RepID=UPI000958F035|nr:MULTISPECIES: HAMP domain-containing histidine kinase [unclassified Pseudonocardia]OLL74401.1 putative two-component system sensor kinase [Pseudonocardia sp. Ae150A_Ps1]OLL80381.1 putative two-component system sensor kinase [Pseudonocardia sp. Ae168_Ps1]OLL85492.1 putative two-component system sensor kinase [Pseudonocardia sp. Ae263_Ps1]OLL94481.1 putative two-component system sensor kinase [Pseudonocardia sp. Ae356_Ps1]